MSATRTQVYLSEEQRDGIDRIAASEGITMAEVIRRALDEYLAHEADPATVLASTFGAAPAAETPSRDTSRRG
jgi:hypothetical protein